MVTVCIWVSMVSIRSQFSVSIYENATLICLCDCGGLMVGRHNLHTMSCEFESQMSMVVKGRASDFNFLLSSNEVFSMKQAPRPCTGSNDIEYTQKQMSKCNPSNEKGNVFRQPYLYSIIQSFRCAMHYDPFLLQIVTLVFCCSVYEDIGMHTHSFTVWLRCQNSAMISSSWTAIRLRSRNV